MMSCAASSSESEWAGRSLLDLVDWRLRWDTKGNAGVAATEWAGAIAKAVDAAKEWRVETEFDGGAFWAAESDLWGLAAGPAAEGLIGVALDVAVLALW